MVLCDVAPFCHQARALEPHVATGTADPYIVVRVGGEQCRSVTKRVGVLAEVVTDTHQSNLTCLVCVCVAGGGLQLTTSPVYYQTLCLTFRSLPREYSPPVRTSSPTLSVHGPSRVVNHHPSFLAD